MRMQSAFYSKCYFDYLVSVLQVASHDKMALIWWLLFSDGSIRTLRTFFFHYFKHMFQISILFRP